MSSSPWNLSGGGRRLLASSVQPVACERELAAAGLERRPLDADDVAEVEADEAVERLLAEHVARAWIWILPLPSTRSRKAALPWPRRAAIRPATR